MYPWFPLDTMVEKGQKNNYYWMHRCRRTFPYIENGGKVTETQSLKTAIKETLIKGAMIGHNTSANSSGKELPLLPSDTTSRTFIITNLLFM